MSDTFTASNGLLLRPNRDGSVRWEAGFDPVIVTQALREFFQHERDKELGRWRWPEKPDYVVFPSELYLTPPNVDLVTVFNERTGQSAHCRREDEGNSGHFSLAARAYFAAHPEPKPEWHDAKPGEVWVLRVRDESEERPYTVGDTGFNGEDIRGEYWGAIPLDSHVFTAGRRIWPEAPSE